MIRLGQVPTAEVLRESGISIWWPPGISSCDDWASRLIRGEGAGGGVPWIPPDHPCFPVLRSLASSRTLPVRSEPFSCDHPSLTAAERVVCHAFGPPTADPSGGGGAGGIFSRFGAWAIVGGVAAVVGLLLVMLAMRGLVR
jgi:hypothetical protein